MVGGSEKGAKKSKGVLSSFGSEDWNPPKHSKAMLQPCSACSRPGALRMRRSIPDRGRTRMFSAPTNPAESVPMLERMAHAAQPGSDSASGWSGGVVPSLGYF